MKKRGAGQTHYSACKSPVIHHSPAEERRLPILCNVPVTFSNYANFDNNVLSLLECRLSGPASLEFMLPPGQSQSHLRLIIMEESDHKVAGGPAAKMMNFKDHIGISGNLE